MKLVIDNRERKLIEKLTDKIQFEVKQLDIGDLIFYNDNGKEELIIERKTISDLASSIVDGRYKEQSFRLSNHPLHNHNIIYLIEGNIQQFNSFGKINSDTIYSSLFSINYTKGFSVIKSNNLTETSVIISKMCSKLTKDNNCKSFFDKECTVERDYSAVIKNEKKSNITSENIHVIMLSQIPYISSTIAKAILNKHEFKQIVTNVDTIDFSEIKTISNGKERKISKKAIENLKKFI
jgi:ERCC4-type nuclease